MKPLKIFVFLLVLSTTIFFASAETEEKIVTVPINASAALDENCTGANLYFYSGQSSYEWFINSDGSKDFIFYDIVDLECSSTTLAQYAENLTILCSEDKKFWMDKYDSDCLSKEDGMTYKTKYELMKTKYLDSECSEMEDIKDAKEKCETKLEGVNDELGDARQQRGLYFIAGLAACFIVQWFLGKQNKPDSGPDRDYPNPNAPALEEGLKK